jgi:DNA-binding NarL/FixJ family response regulator
MMMPATPHIVTKTVVLLIEHDQLTLRVLRGILRSRGFDVIAIGELDGFERIMPVVDVVICAYDMPFVPVTDLLQKIKREWPSKRVFLTSVTSFHELTEGTHSHIEGFIPKPLEMDQLNDMIGLIAA